MSEETISKTDLSVSALVIMIGSFCLPQNRITAVLALPTLSKEIISQIPPLSAYEDVNDCSSSPEQETQMFPAQIMGISYIFFAKCRFMDLI